MSTPFAELRFNDPGRAFAALEALLQEVPSDLAQHLAYALEESAEPDLVLTRLERYLGSSLSRASELDRMAQAPFYARLLARIFDQSSFLTDIVCRNPEYVTWLWDEVDLNVTPPKEVLALELAHLIAAFDTFADHCKALRRFKRREFLRIAVRDVFAHCDLADVVEDLSNLADVTLEAACESAHRALIKRYGAAHGTIEGGLAIIAMGKLGGRELNFSSDIDLMFLHTGDAAGEHPLGRSRAEYFQKAGELIIKAISENSADGHVFRVDMRLRPHGNRGPLATAEQTALVYYEQVGQAWERQALLKARAVAGDLVLGERFIERTRPFVFPRYFDDSILEDIREVKQQMEALVEQRGETETEVKLGRGGIRDIEFTIQVLQLLNGGRFEELRTTNTLEAIEALGLRHLLRPLDAATLSSNYVFLRQVEHRLQIENSQQVHALPKKAEALETFARRMGYASAASFMSEYRDRTEANRTILDQFLATEGAGFRWVKDLLNAHSAAESSLPKLEELGFQELERARRELLLLCNGTVGRP
ncbi:MAG: hypothetical protein KJ052_10515, partial [Candidatus Hydrogenedentes bacterium]|nr:hypothetical protein [Candidatus Hydrogenedentota bacterium]